MSLDNTKEKLEWCNRAFECELENAYYIKIQNGMPCMNDNKVNNIYEWILLNDILNPLKHTKNLNIHYSSILHGCMNAGKGEANFRKFWILLDSACSSTIVMLGRIEKFGYKKILWCSGTHKLVTLLIILRLSELYLT